METEKIVEKIEGVVEAIKKPKHTSKIIAGFSYLGVLAIGVLAIKPKSEYVRFHLRQGVVLFLAEIVFTLIWIIPFIGWVIGFLGWILCLVLSVVAFAHAISGKKWKIPIVYGFSKKVNL
ncbi:hypothetical protein ISS06_00915 [Patescibacteria group bacterium]|nr:hypothetical protein [Patescibacteria group bacterium]